MNKFNARIDLLYDEEIKLAFVKATCKTTRVRVVER